MIFIYLDAPDGLMKLGVICGRKFDKSAVRRNRARRLVREAFRLLRNGVVDAHILVIPKKAIMRCKTPQVQEELIRLLIKAGLWKEKQVF